MNDELKEILAWVTVRHYPKDNESGPKSFVNMEDENNPAMFGAERDANAFARELRRRLKAAFLYGKLSGLKERLDEDHSPNIRRLRRVLISMGYNER
jgi:hypothetical protein